MRHARLAPKPPRHGTDTIGVRRLALTALAALAIAPAASAAMTTHELKLDSTMFAAQIGSTTNGGNVYAGAVVDPRLGHSAAVYSANGTTSVRVIFHEYLSLGSIKGTGRVTIVPSAVAGRSTFTGALKVTSGTGAYDGAHGKLRITGTSDSTGMTTATIRGTFNY